MQTKDIEIEINNLRDELSYANEQYYKHHTSPMSDEEFDIKMHRLEELERQLGIDDPTSPTRRVGSDRSSLSSSSNKHLVPMLSIANTYSEEEMHAWYDGICKTLGVKDVDVTIEHKYDGLSIALRYEDGILAKALTRGDGEYGEDVTEQAHYIEGIPHTLEGDWPQYVELRGEVVMPFKAFEACNQVGMDFANPRNAASGTLKSKNPTLCRTRGLKFFLYRIIGTDIKSQAGALQTASRNGFYMSCFLGGDCFDNIWDIVSRIGESRKNEAFPTDGAVIKVSSFRLQELLGSTAKAPRWAIAFKYKAENKGATLLDIEWTLGKSGRVTPTAVFTPLQLAGTTVTRATLNNPSWISELTNGAPLYKGDTIYVEKGGEIIPKVTKVENTGRGDILFYPSGELENSLCPECGKPLSFDGTNLTCTNPDCIGIRKQRFLHFCSKDAMNIKGIGDELVEKIFAIRPNTSVTDIYNGKVMHDRIYTVTGSMKVAKNIQQEIEESKTREPWRLLHALCIPRVGVNTSKALLKKYHSIDKVFTEANENLCGMADTPKGSGRVGEAAAQSILNWQFSPDNVKVYSFLRGVLNVVAEPATSSSSSLLSGKTIVVSGTFATPARRKELEQMVTDNGGILGSGVSKKTAFVVAGEGMGPSKREKAEKLGVSIITEDDFLKMI